MAKLADLNPILDDDNDKRTMEAQLDECGEVLAEMRTELAAYWARVEAMELMMGGLRKIIRRG